MENIFPQDIENKSKSTNESDFKPRCYQIDLYEKAVQNNIILYLPTGAGKTYIAVMLLKHLSGDLHKPYNKDGKRIIFVVNTVALVIQQAKYISRHTGLICKGYSGDMQVDFWQEEQWLSEIETNQVLVMTAQIFVDLLSHSYMKLDKVKLIIFDECHRAVSNHPMRQIMQRFEDCPKDKQPRVLAMSATLLNANIKSDKIESTIRALEITFHAKIATVESIDCIQGYCTNPKENIIKYEKHEENPKIMGKVTHIMHDCVEILQNIKISLDDLYKESSKSMRPKSRSSKLISIITDIETITSQAEYKIFNKHLMYEILSPVIGIYGGSKSALLHLIQLESLRKYSDNPEIEIVLDYLITQIILIRKIFDNEMKDYTELQRLYKFTSDQIHKLFEILIEYKNKLLSDQKFCCIIFVKERFTAQVLYHILKLLSSQDEHYSFLLPDYVLGFQNNPYKYSKEILCISKWNKEVLKRFKSGLSNCVVATDVVDEGIDIPTCTLIIRYDVPLDFRGYVQSKGRARHNTSHYIILMSNNDIAFLQKYQYYKYTEFQLKQILVGQSELRTLPTDSDITDCLYTDFEIKPYIVRCNDTVGCITEVTAINLINAYCQTLLRSKFVHLVPVWKLNRITNSDGTELFKISLKLPNISPLKTEIQGDVMKNIESAKRSAALNSCIQLHKKGALTDKLLPVTANDITQNMDHLFPNWINEDNDLSGTYKKKREHKLEYPTALYGAFPQSSEQLYLHVLDCTSTYFTTSYDNRRIVFHNLLKDKSSFGILSTKSMPKIPSFPIFMKDGKLNIDVKSDYATFILSRNEIELLKKFHFLLFNEVIPVIKNFMLFDNDNLENSFLIVPLNDKKEINWHIVRLYQSLERIIPSKPFHFKSSDYELALVTPTYRGSMHVYIVTRVCDDLTPESCFPNEDFDTFTDYYKEKHGLIIQDLKQSMLEVKPIPIRINYTVPRKLTDRPLKYKKADDTVEDLQEHLIPELCWRINFPAIYWLKATTLPSILHRVSQLLIAEDLRVIIARETGLGPLTSQECSNLVLDRDIERLKEEDSGHGLDLNMDDSVVTMTQLDEPCSNMFELDATNYDPYIKDQEPQDIYRNIEEIQMIDIQYYNQFMYTNDDEDIVPENTKQSIGQYIARPIVSTPVLKVLMSSDKSFISNGPSLREIVHALTTKLGGDMFNLERLETLGDSYLKFMTSLFLYHEFPEYNEGPLTALKGKIIGNRNLYYCGNKKNIPGRIKNDAFIPTSNFIAPAYTVLRPLQKILLNESVAPNVLYELQIPEDEKYIGIISGNTKDMMEQTVIRWDKEDRQNGFEHYLGIQILSDKTVADSIEALIGVYVRSNGIKGAAKLLKWFDILPSIQIDKLLDNIPPNPIIGKGDPNYHMPWADSAENRFGYKFKNRAYLLQAFTHPSYTPNGITECYQRLEFLGDAILDFLITCYIYENCGNLSPGDLTDLRSALVNNITFACLAVRYGMHTALLAYAPKLHEVIDRFVKFQEERDYIIDDELLNILIEEEDCNIAEYIDFPKVLGDLFESLIGAIYLDSGKDLTKVWEIIYSLMHKEIDKFSKNVPKQPIRLIHENTDARPKFLEATQIKGMGTIMVSLKVTIAGKEKLFYGFGVNKKQAKCAAAKQALKRLHLEK